MRLEDIYGFIGIGKVLKDFPIETLQESINKFCVEGPCKEVVSIATDSSIPNEVIRLYNKLVLSYDNGFLLVNVFRINTESVVPQYLEESPVVLNNTQVATGYLKDSNITLFLFTSFGFNTVLCECKESSIMRYVRKALMLEKFDTESIKRKWNPYGWYERELLATFEKTVDNCVYLITDCWTGKTLRLTSRVTVLEGEGVVTDLSETGEVIDKFLDNHCINKSVSDIAWTPNVDCFMNLPFKVIL